jgi:hypothetical protein
MIKLLAAAFSLVGQIFKNIWFKMVKRSGELEAYTKVQNEQVEDLNKGIAAQQRFDDNLVSNPSSLRDDDQWRLPDQVSVVQPTPSAAVESGVGGPSDQASKEV